MPPEFTQIICRGEIIEAKINSNEGVIAPIYRGAEYEAAMAAIAPGHYFTVNDVFCREYPFLALMGKNGEYAEINGTIVSTYLFAGMVGTTVEAFAALLDKRLAELHQEMNQTSPAGWAY